MDSQKSFSTLPWIALALMWSLLVVGLISLSFDEQEQSIIELAKVQARSSFNKEQAYRQWPPVMAESMFPYPRSTLPVPT